MLVNAWEMARVYASRGGTWQNEQKFKNAGVKWHPGLVAQILIGSKKNNPKVHATPYSSLKQVYLLLNITKPYGTSSVVLKAPKEIKFDNNDSNNSH